MFFAGRITLPDEALHQQGAPGMTKDQALQVLVKMELEGLLNQVTYLVCGSVLSDRCIILAIQATS